MPNLDYTLPFRRLSKAHQDLLTEIASKIGATPEELLKSAHEACISPDGLSEDGLAACCHQCGYLMFRGITEPCKHFKAAARREGGKRKAS